MRADGGGQRRLGGKAVDRRPPGAATGRSSRTPRATCGGSRIVVADADGRKRSSSRLRAPERSPNDGNPSWSPDGERIAVDDIVAAGVSVVTCRTAAGRRSPSTASRPRGRPTASRSRSWISTTARSGAPPERRQPPPAAPRIRGQGHVARLVARREAARVQHADGHLRRRARRHERRRSWSSRPGTRPAEFRPTVAARLRGRCRHRPPLPLGLRRRRRRQRARQLTTGPYDSSDPAWRP